MGILDSLNKYSGGLTAAAPYASLAAGVLGSVFSKKPKTPSMQDQLTMAGKAQYTADYNSMKAKHDAAKQFGYHPLAALGLPTAGSQVVGNFQGGIEGQNLGRSMAANINGFRDAQMSKLTLERARLENELLETQISNINNQAGDPPRVENISDQNTMSMKGDRGLTGGSSEPPPAGKKFTVGSTPYGDVKIVLPPSGQADEYGELYGSMKGIEYLAKRGYVHYMRAGSKIIGKLKGR